MTSLNKKRRNPDAKSIVVIVILCVLVAVVIGGAILYYAINLSPVGWRQSQSSNLPLRTETLASYLEDPSTCAADLARRFENVSLIHKNNTIYDIKLSSKDKSQINLENVDLRVFVPRVPEIAKGDDFLTHITLVQRELNRNDTKFREATQDGGDVNVANNCLRQGLWETYVNRTTGDDQGKIFHGWFEFPVPLYKQVFRAVNGFDLDPYENALQHYLRPDGAVVNLDHLRKVEQEKEIPLDSIDFHLDDPIVHMGEQQHKAKLVVNGDLLKYSDIYEKENQPIKLMQFAEPGIYAEEKVLNFDFSFLGKPNKVTLKKARNDRIGETFNELEIDFPYGQRSIMIKNWPFFVQRNGLRLILGGWKEKDIPLASERPIPAGDFARFTFGIGTPDIYVDYPRRLNELGIPNNVYLLLVDRDGKYIDNHTLGLDQMYISRLPDGTFVTYLVSYERIMLVTAWNFKPPSEVLIPALEKEQGTEPESEPAVETDSKESESDKNIDTGKEGAE